MSLSLNQHKKLYKFANRLDAEILWIGNIRKHNQRGGIIERILVICDNYLLVFTKAKRISRQYHWYHISKAGLHNSIITLMFRAKDKILSFSHHEDDYVYILIVNHVRKLLTDNDFRNLNIDPNSYTLHVRSGSCYIWRFKYFLKNENIKGYDKYIKDFQSILLKESSTFDLSVFKESREALFRTIFNTVQIPYCIKCLLFPKIENFNYFDILISTMKYITVHYLSFESPVFSPSFVIFMNNILDSKDNKLCGMKFKDSKIERHYMDAIMSCVGKSNFHSLSFDNCIDENVLFTIFDHENTKNLRYLSIINTSLKSIYKFEHKFSNLFALSLQNCDLNLAVILSHLQNSSSLRAIDISGNISDLSEITSPIVLPPNLLRLCASDITWKVNDFIRFFNSVIFHKPKDNLDLFQIVLSNLNLDDWSSFFDYLEEKKILSHSLSCMIWDSNPLDKHFLEFLSRCECLTTLSVNNCVDDNCVVDFVEFLKKSNSLSHLDVRGDESRHLTRTSELFNQLSVQRALTFVDISNHYFNDNDVSEFISLIAKSQSIEGFSLDGTQISSVSPWMNALDALLDRKIKCTISIPYNDIKRLTGKNNQVHLIKEVDDMLKQINALSRIGEEEFFSPIDPVRSFYYYEQDPFFPLYLRPSIIRSFEGLNDESKKDYNTTKSQCLSKSVLTSKSGNSFISNVDTRYEDETDEFYSDKSLCNNDGDKISSEQNNSINQKITDKSQSSFTNVDHNCSINKKDTGKENEPDSSEHNYYHAYDNNNTAFTNSKSYTPPIKRNKYDFNTKTDKNNSKNANSRSLTPDMGVQRLSYSKYFIGSHVLIIANKIHPSFRGGNRSGSNYGIRHYSCNDIEINKSQRIELPTKQRRNSYSCPPKRRSNGRIDDTEAYRRIYSKDMVSKNGHRSTGDNSGAKAANNTTSGDDFETRKSRSRHITTRSPKGRRSTKDKAGAKATNSTTSGDDFELRKSKARHITTRSPKNHKRKSDPKHISSKKADLSDSHIEGSQGKIALEDDIDSSDHSQTKAKSSKSSYNNGTKSLGAIQTTFLFEIVACNTEMKDETGTKELKDAASSPRSDIRLTDIGSQGEREAEINNAAKNNDDDALRHYNSAPNSFLKLSPLYKRTRDTTATIKEWQDLDIDINSSNMTPTYTRPSKVIQHNDSLSNMGITNELGNETNYTPNKDMNTDIMRPKVPMKSRPSGRSPFDFDESDDKPTVQKQRDFKEDWSFPLRYIPEIDNTDLIEKTEKEFTFIDLVKGLIDT